MPLPLPKPTPLSQPFWDGCNRHQLRVQQCRDCGKKIFTPLPVCPSCHGERLEWIVSPGVGTLYSYTVAHRPASPEFTTPYIIGTVDLDDGWSMLTRIVQCDPAQVRCDMRVAVKFEKATDEITLPCFAPLK